MKKFYILLLAIFALNVANAQSCLPQGITFSTQAQIDSFQASYPNCTQIEGDVTFMGSNISNLNGLSVLTSIGGTVSIYIDGLASLAGLENLTSIGGGLIIQNNDSLVNLAGLENLTAIGGGIWLRYNPSLASLTGLDNVTNFGGLVWITDNDTLCACSVQSICNYLAGSGTAWIENNATGCNSRAEVEGGCGVGFEEHHRTESQFYIYPNPAYSVLTVESSAFQANTILDIMNVSGTELVTRKITGPKMQLDISDLPAGMYFVKLRNMNTAVVRKLIIE